ncbi:hypothetical protein ACOZ38_00835 [Sphaerisporangium viridialbum]|uniref:hypothetical protein n=1 Tax=Sphaerisporangium viridialbum TaxID=46189 RepID=UPI003C78A2C1
MSGMPHWRLDPLVDRDAHQLQEYDDLTAIERLAPFSFGACSCGEWTTPNMTIDDVLAAFDAHMRQVQVAARASRPWHDRDDPAR